MRRPRRWSGYDPLADIDRRIAQQAITDRAGHSGLMLAARITLAHLLICIS